MSCLWIYKALLIILGPFQLAKASGPRGQPSPPTPLPPPSCANTLQLGGSTGVGQVIASQAVPRAAPTPRWPGIHPPAGLGEGLDVNVGHSLAVVVAPPTPFPSSPQVLSDTESPCLASSAAARLHTHPQVWLQASPRSPFAPMSTITPQVPPAAASA